MPLIIRKPNAVMSMVAGGASTHIINTDAKPSLWPPERKWPKLSAETPGKTIVAPTVPETARQNEASCHKMMFDVWRRCSRAGAYAV